MEVSQEDAGSGTGESERCGEMERGDGRAEGGTSGRMGDSSDIWLCGAGVTMEMGGGGRQKVTGGTHPLNHR